MAARRLLLIALAIGLALVARPARAQCPPRSAAVIGPGTRCEACWANPTTLTTGAPLLELLTTVRVYLDPPLEGPIIGTTPPAFTAPLGNGVAGATNTVALCANLTPAPATGPHTLSVSVTTATAESAGSTPPLAFWFQGIPSAPAAGVVFR